MQDYFSVQHEQSGQDRKNFEYFPLLTGKTGKMPKVPLFPLRHRGKIQILHVYGRVSFSSLLRYNIPL